MLVIIASCLVRYTDGYTDTHLITRINWKRYFIGAEIEVDDEVLYDTILRMIHC